MKVVPTAAHRQGDPTGGGNAPVLVCRGVSARYGPIEVCRDIDLSLKAGELLAILGPNGAGKSSLLGALSGLVQSRGAIELDGVDLARKPAHARARSGLAFVPEVRGNICPALTVEENIGLGLRMIEGDRSGALDHVFGLFPILKERLRAPAGMLSGGEQQMLAIGMAAARAPRVLLLDEPTQGLAPAVYDILQAAFGSLLRSGIGLLVAEQNVAFAARIADRFVVLADGDLVMSGGKAELAQHETIFASFLGSDDDAEADEAEEGTPMQQRRLNG